MLNIFNYWSSLQYAILLKYENFFSRVFGQLYEYLPQRKLYPTIQYLVMPSVWSIRILSTIGLGVYIGSCVICRLAPRCCNMACTTLALYGADGLLSPLCLCYHLLGDNSARFCCANDAPYPHTWTANVFLCCKVCWIGNEDKQSIVYSNCYFSCHSLFGSELLQRSVVVIRLFIV